MAENETNWVTRVTGVSGSKVDFKHKRMIHALGGMKQDICHLTGFIDFDGDQEPLAYKVYNVDRHGTVIGHAQFTELNAENKPDWNINLFNVVRGRC